ncbi:DUF397 domain-containing protein [uncultured Streptomyces sp.]|uniref:DUF397 domain-containing protein n=1 Tax=uncultured Streptomyces sp. TaxID=174707 RepID=UPI0026072930|nr:DUF397 domain-containing protein [uncultured Streptomyces sp.]
MTARPEYFKSSYSDNGGNCVEVAANLIGTHDLVPVRDSKNPEGPSLGFASAAFASFVAGVKAGEFAV